MHLVSTGLDQDNTTEHTVRFNDKNWHNFFENPNASLIRSLPVMSYLNETGNTAHIQSSIRSRDSDYLVNRNAILVVEHQGSEHSEITRNSTTSGIERLAPPDDMSDTPLLMNESDTCQITLDSDPEGALVYLDGIYQGKTTPHILDARKGDRHTVRFELDGYMPSETSFIANNSTFIRPSLYAPVHTTKGRLNEIPEDPDGIRYGGLYITSRPDGATISIDGTETGKTTPSVFMGLEPGSHTIKLVHGMRDTTSRLTSDFVFEEQSALVFPGVLGLADINGIGNNQLFNIIIDSRNYRGLPLSVDGYLINATVPAKVSAPHSNSFVTIHENESFVSYPIPVITEEDRYFLIKPRNYQNLSISVDSDPHGAEIFVDGFRTGYTTPYTFGSISDGPHRIIVTKNGYLPQQNLLDLPRRSVPISTTLVDFTLEEYPSGFLYVDSIPRWRACINRWSEHRRDYTGVIQIRAHGNPFSKSDRNKCIKNIFRYHHHFTGDG